MNILENIRKECVYRKINVEKLTDLMEKAGERYLSQFIGELKAANAMALGALLAGDADPHDFAVLSEEMIKKTNNNSKNYFEILLEECKQL
jgi:hypothetical protein